MFQLLLYQFLKIVISFKDIFLKKSFKRRCAIGYKEKIRILYEVTEIRNVLLFF